MTDTHITAPINATALALADRHRKRAVADDLYGAAGTRVYEDLAAVDHTEIDDFRAIARRWHPRAVCELAAGSGRITLPLLDDGHAVTAVDLSPSMLGILVAKAGDRALTAVHGDMTYVHLDQLFDLIILGTTSVSLVDDAGRAELLATVRRHLRVGGRFAATTVTEGDVSTPDLALVATGASRTQYCLTESWPRGAGARTVAIMPVADLTDPAAETVTVFTSEIRVVPVEVLTAEMSAAGFAVDTVKTISLPGARHHHVLIEAERVS